MNRLRKRIALSLTGASMIIAMAAPMAANAAVTTFTGQDDGAAIGGTFTNSNAAWANFYNSALSYSSLVSTGFETLATGFSTSYALPTATLTLNAFNYGNEFSGISQGNTLGNLYGFDVGNGTGKWLGFPGGTATITFDGLSNSFGFYATGIQSTFGTVFQVTYGDGTTSTLDIPINDNGGVSFFGFTDSQAFKSVTISRPGGDSGTDAWGIDNLTYGLTVAAVPEPSTWAMMILGIAGIGMAARRSRRKATPALAFARA